MKAKRMAEMTDVTDAERARVVAEHFGWKLLGDSPGYWNSAQDFVMTRDGQTTPMASEAMLLRLLEQGYQPCQIGAAYRYISHDRGWTSESPDYRLATLAAMYEALQ